MDAGQIITTTLSVPGSEMVFAINPITIKMTWIVIGFIVVFMLLLKGGIKEIPGRPQVFLESLFEWFDSVLEEGMGKDGRKFFPFVVTIFLFVLFSNWLNLIPGLQSPTKDFNTCLGLAILVFLVAHYSSIRRKGLAKYIKSYFQPFWFLFPSNVIGEFSKVLSHSFRLFGNIFAGGIVISVIPALLMQLPKWAGVPLNLILMPTFVMGFFGFFLAAVQAFVFAMLAIAYISVLR